MRKKYLKLTKDQKERGVIFSSTLIPNDRINMDLRTHEVKADDPDKREKIERLKDDKFFNNSPYKYNLIRQ